MPVESCPTCSERGRFLGINLGCWWLTCKQGHVWDEEDGSPHPLGDKPLKHGG